MKKFLTLTIVLGMVIFSLLLVTTLTSVLSKDLHNKILKEAKLTNSGPYMMDPGAARYNIYDDEKSTVIIYVDDTALYSDSETQAINNVVIKKHAWQMMNNNKKIIAMTSATGENKRGHAMTTALIIEYEKVK